MRNRAYDIAFYSVVLLVCILLFYWLKAADDNTMKLLLYPHAKLTELYYNTSMTYVNGVGYSSLDNTFAIGRQCMGSNFIIMMFGMTACLFADYFKGTKKAVWLIATLIGSIVTGILISCIRIIGSIPFVTHPKFAVFHSTIGITLYLFALIASYAVLKKIIRGDLSEKSI